MSPTKFRLNPTYCSGADVVWLFPRWPPWRPSWILERNDFNYSESLYRSNASHRVSAQSNLQFWRRCCLKISRSWISKWNDFRNSESLCCSDASHQVSAQFNLWFGMRSFEEFQDGRLGRILRQQNVTILAIRDLHVATMPPTKFQLNQTYGSGGYVENVKS